MPVGDLPQVCYRLGGLDRTVEPEQIRKVALQALQIGVDISYRIVDRLPS